jgi:hypothetical protein
MGREARFFYDYIWYFRHGYCPGGVGVDMEGVVKENEVLNYS